MKRFNIHIMPVGGDYEDEIYVDCKESVKECEGGTLLIDGYIKIDFNSPIIAVKEVSPI